jgi:hypothetical protein
MSAANVAAVRRRVCADQPRLATEACAKLKAGHLADGGLRTGKSSGGRRVLFARQAHGLHLKCLFAGVRIVAGAEPGAHVPEKLISECTQACRGNRAGKGRRIAKGPHNRQADSFPAVKVGSIHNQRMGKPFGGQLLDGG